MNSTYYQDVSLIISPHFTTTQIKKARASVYARTMSSPLPPADLIFRGSPCVTTENSLLLRFSFQDPSYNPTHIIFTHGGIPAHITTDWTEVPGSLRPKAHRLLHRLLITHHHSTLLARNKVAHPQTEAQPIIT